MIAFPQSPAIQALLEAELALDLGAYDLTSAAIPAWRSALVSATLIAKEDGVIAGLPIYPMVFDILSGPGPNLVNTESLVQMGLQIQAGQEIARFRGPGRILLGAERTGLNLISHLCGISTLTAQFVKQCAGTRAQICDTRKTLPGLRVLQKYAVRCGGGVNHRFSLNDAVMLKDNHLALWQGSVAELVAKVREGLGPTTKIELEVGSVAEFEAAASAKVDIIMLDNMSVAEMAACCANRPEGILLEASGNVTLDRVAEIAATGVDYISVGCLTHSAPSLDLSLEM